MAAHAPDGALPDGAPENETAADPVESLLAGSPLGAVVTLGLRPVYGNGPAAALLGAAPWETLPLRRRDRPRLEQLAAAGRGSLSRLAVKPAEGRIAWVDLTVAPLTFRGQAGLVWWIADVTDGRRAAHRLTVAQARAAAGTRGRARLLATLGQDMRQPVAGLLNTAGRLLDTPLDGGQRALAEDMRYGAKALLALLSDLLDVSALDSGSMVIAPAPLDLRRLVDSLMSLVEPRARQKGLACRVIWSPNLPRRVTGDGDRLRQILWNLLSNALRFTSSGHIGLTIAGVPAGEGWRLRFTVEDTGIGLAEDLRRRLFHEAVPARLAAGRRLDGTGLGLLLCHKIVDLWGGGIGVDSLPGRGATFWVDLPFGAALTDGESLRLLVAEDNPVNQKIITGLLARQGHRVEVAENGRQAVRAAAGQGFDAILMDMQMPVLDGLAAAEAIRALPGPAGRVPIIALTAGGQPGDEERCLAAGMNDYVAKPIRPDVLFAALRRQTGALPPCAALPPPVTPLDGGQIAELEKTIGRSGTVDLVALFIADARDRCRALLALREAPAADLTRMRELAHDLKSTAGNFGFTGLSRLAAAIEQACREERPDEALGLLEHLQGRWSDALAAAHRQIPELSSPESSPVMTE